MLGKIQNAKITETVKTAKTNEIKNETNQQEIKDGKKKLALALGALGVAGAGIVIAAKSGKLSSLRKVKSATTNAKDEIKEVVLKKPKRFTPTSSSYVTKTGTDGKTKTFLKEVGTISNPNFRHGKEFTIEKITDLSTGKIVSCKDLTSPPIIEKTTKKIHIPLENGKEIAFFTPPYLEQKGNILSGYLQTSKFDKETGLLTIIKQPADIKKTGVLDAFKGRISKKILDKKTGSYLFYGEQMEYHYQELLDGKLQDKRIIFQRGAGSLEDNLKKFASQIKEENLKKVAMEPKHLFDQGSKNILSAADSYFPEVFPKYNVLTNF